MRAQRRTNARIELHFGAKSRVLLSAEIAEHLRHDLIIHAEHLVKKLLMRARLRARAETLAQLWRKLPALPARPALLLRMPRCHRSDILRQRILQPLAGKNAPVKAAQPGPHLLRVANCHAQRRCASALIERHPAAATFPQQPPRDVRLFFRIAADAERHLLQRWRSGSVLRLRAPRRAAPDIRQHRTRPRNVRVQLRRLAPETVAHHRVLVKIDRVDKFQPQTRQTAVLRLVEKQMAAALHRAPAQLQRPAEQHRLQIRRAVAIDHAAPQPLLHRRQEIHRREIVQRLHKICMLEVERTRARLAQPIQQKRAQHPARQRLPIELKKRLQMLREIHVHRLAAAHKLRQRQLPTPPVAIARAAAAAALLLAGEDPQRRQIVEAIVQRARLASADQRQQVRRFEGTARRQHVLQMHLSLLVLLHRRRQCAQGEFPAEQRQRVQKRRRIGHRLVLAEAIDAVERIFLHLLRIRARKPHRARLLRPVQIIRQDPVQPPPVVVRSQRLVAIAIIIQQRPPKLFVKLPSADKLPMHSHRAHLLCRRCYYYTISDDAW